MLLDHHDRERAAPGAGGQGVHEETNGNPFFVREVVRLLLGAGRLANPEDMRSWRCAVPQGVREVLARRLDDLSPASLVLSSPSPATLRGCDRAKCT
jgi:hypothetical protein